MSPFTREDVARIFDVPVKLLRPTRCWLDTCRQPAHVILYASGDRLAGLQTRPRQAVQFCLHHGGQVYDVIRAWRKPARTMTDVARANHSAPCPTWLVADLKADRLPRTSPDPKGWPAASPMATSRHRPTRDAR
jgi:hypothetical protein